MERQRASAVALAVLLAVVHASPGAALQVVSGELDTAVVVADSSDLLGVARAAQGRFERGRVSHFPLTLETFGGSCDEHVGRFCSWYDEGDWYPQPEDPEIGVLRAELLMVLDSVQAELPGDGWVLGQRVWYLADEARWEEALEAARACGAVDRWWCSALEGLSLHGLQRYAEAHAAFSGSLDRMDAEQAFEWRVPRRAMDGDGRDILEGLKEASPDSVDAVLDRLWLLADPLYLVPGNDRETSHYARWTVATLRERARNPYRISWGRDLEQLVIRHGWEMGWERAPSRGFTSLDHVIGHKHPEGRDYMPSGRALEAPGLAEPADLRADVRRPRSLYAPAYAPVLLPIEGQIAVFPRGPRMVVVATHFLPDDTTRHVGHRHPLPWLEAGDQAGVPDRAGIFLAPADGTPMRGARASGGTEGVLSLEAPVGSYVVSIETWSPEQRRAGRFRVGIRRRPVPDDVAALSDILMLTPSSVEPELLEAAVPTALLRTEILPGQTFAIGWEVSGLGFRPETLRFEVSVERTNRGVLRRVGEFLRITDRPQPLRLSWEEPGPPEPGPLFRYVDLDLPVLDQGDYEIRLVLKSAGRTDVVSSRAFSVRVRG